MRFLGIDINSANENDKLRKEILETKKSLMAVQDVMANFNSRPPITDMGIYGSGLDWAPANPQAYAELYDIVHYSDILNVCLLSLKREIFRNGWKFNPRFDSKCMNEKCGQEYEYKTPYCDQCKTATRSPDFTQIRELEKEFRKRINMNGQNITDVLLEIEKDADIADDTYLYLHKNYIFGPEGNILMAEVMEILRIHPAYVELIMDGTGRPGFNRDGIPQYVCVRHRENVTKSQNCTKCGCETRLAFYKIRTSTDESKAFYYAENEIVHKAKYNPTLAYGFPPLISVHMKARSLMLQDQYIKDWYGLRRPPKGFLVFNTTNKQALEKSLDEEYEELKRNPHHIPTLVVESNSQTGETAQFISFMTTLTDMQYIETRNEYRKSIGAVYGVEPIFMNDTSTSGGLNNEGLQITVSNRAVEWGQEFINGLMQKVCEQFNVTDWKWELEPSEEQDETAVLDRELKKVQIAQAYRVMGFQPVLNEQGEFEYEGEATPFMQESFLGGDNKPEEADQQNSGEPKKGIPVTKGLTQDEKDYVKSNLYNRTFEGLTMEESGIIKTILLNAIDAISPISEIVRKIVISIPELTPGEAERIVRTEDQALRLKLREFQYKQIHPDDIDTIKFKWLSIPDHRRTQCCQKISERTANGVTLDKLKEIVDEEGKKFMGESWKQRDYVPHINCRSVFIRHFD